MTVMPEGKYRARVEDYGVFQSSAGNQHPTAFVRFRLTGRYGGPGDRLEECPKESREYFKAITEKTIVWLLSDLQAIGFDKDGLKFFDPETPGAADLFGREIDVACEHGEYEGTTRERWSIYREKK